MGWVQLFKIKMDFPSSPFLNIHLFCLWNEVFSDFARFDRDVCHTCAVLSYRGAYVDFEGILVGSYLGKFVATSDERMSPGFS